MEPVVGVLVLSLLFAGTHIGLASRRPRAALVARLGEQGFDVVFFLVAAASFTALVRFYALHRFGETTCVEAATGKLIWRVNVSKETGIRVPDWGYTGAPLVHEGLLILNVGDAGVALDPKTGKVVWKSADKAAGYSSPLPARPAEVAPQHR